MYTKGDSESVKSSGGKNSSVTTGSDTYSLDFNTTSVPVLDTPTITNLVLSSLEGVQSGVPTRTTATLTPTTLRNIEQYLEYHPVSPPESHSNQAGFVPPPVLSTTANTFVDNKSWGGGIATITSVREHQVSNAIAEMPSVSPPVRSPAEPTTRRSGGRRPTNIERLSPEEEVRRTQRRERNKEAAARCRKRRLDQTMNLQEETDGLEDKRSSLQKEIEILQRQKDDLEFILATHEPICKRSSRIHSSQGVKREPLDQEDLELDVKYESGHSVMDKYQSMEPMTNGKKRGFPQRPTSLAVVPISKGVSEIGVAIETPSNALKGFGITLDSIMEGGTGLTPVSNTGFTPLTSSVTMGLSSGMNTLNTPIIPTTNCGSQQRSISCELTSSDVSPSKLVSL